MSIFAQLRDAAAREGLQFLVIGAHAVIEHGLQRGTEDADILVPKEDRARWTQVIECLGYRLYHESDTFLQYTPPDPTQWNLDLMLVPTASFTQLIADAKSAKAEGTPVIVPSLEHLIALKLHALKHGRGLRVLKDTTDVAELLKANNIDSKSPWLAELFAKHADKSIYERILQLLS